MSKPHQFKLPTIAWLALGLLDVNRNEVAEGDAEDGIDVRLQVTEVGFYLRSGDASYDTDHSGFWGASSVPGAGKRFNSREVARDLIDQVRDHMAQTDIES